MATINISDLKPAGLELFSDSESYMNELSDSELNTINGGTAPIAGAIVAGVAASLVVEGVKAISNPFNSI